MVVRGGVGAAARVLEAEFVCRTGAGAADGSAASGGAELPGGDGAVPCVTGGLGGARTLGAGARGDAVHGVAGGDPGAARALERTAGYRGGLTHCRAHASWP